MLLLSFLVLISVVHDPERHVDRIQNSVQESLENFMSYANSQRLTEDHKEQIKISQKLEHLADQLHRIAESATH